MTSEPDSAPPMVLVESLTRRFNGLVAVDAIDIRVARAEIYGLLGPNGAGKTTTFKMLTTLLAPSAGRAVVAGFDVAEHPREVRKRIGYVPQLVSADGALTGRENLLLSARLYGVPAELRRRRVEEALKFMDIAERGGDLVRTYSGGMIRRLEIAQAMLHRPDVLFLDEPTIGLDPLARRSVWERLLELRRDLSATVLISTHDMEEADTLCDRLSLLHHGKVAASGTPAALKASAGPKATLADVFARVCGGAIQESGDFRDVQRARRTARRLG